MKFNTTILVAIFGLAYLSSCSNDWKNFPIAAMTQTEFNIGEQDTAYQFTETYNDIGQHTGWYTSTSTDTFRYPKPTIEGEKAIYYIDNKAYETEIRSKGKLVRFNRDDKTPYVQYVDKNYNVIVEVMPQTYSQYRICEYTDISYNDKNLIDTCKMICYGFSGKYNYELELPRRDPNHDFTDTLIIHRKYNYFN